MFESMKITRDSFDAVDTVSTLDLGEHLLDVGGWIRAARSLADGGELLARIDRRFITARRTQRLADPFGHAHPMVFGRDQGVRVLDAKSSRGQRPRPLITDSAP